MSKKEVNSIAYVILMIFAILMIIDWLNNSYVLNWITQKWEWYNSSWDKIEPMLSIITFACATIANWKQIQRFIRRRMHRTSKKKPNEPFLYDLLKPEEVINSIFRDPATPEYVSRGIETHLQINNKSGYKYFLFIAGDGEGKSRECIEIIRRLCVGKPGWTVIIPRSKVINPDIDWPQSKYKNTRKCILFIDDIDKMEVVASSDPSDDDTIKFDENPIGFFKRIGKLVELIKSQYEEVFILMAMGGVASDINKLLKIYEKSGWGKVMISRLPAHDKEQIALIVDSWNRRSSAQLSEEILAKATETFTGCIGGLIQLLTTYSSSPVELQKILEHERPNDWEMVAISYLCTKRPSSKILLRAIGVLHSVGIVLYSKLVIELANRFPDTVEKNEDIHQVFGGMLHFLHEDNHRVVLPPGILKIIAEQNFDLSINLSLIAEALLAVLDDQKKQFEIKYDTINFAVRCRSEFRRSDLSVSILEKLTSVYPEDSYIHNLLAMEYSKCGNQKKSVEYCISIMKHHYGFPQLHGTLAYSLSRMKKYDEADKVLLSALEQFGPQHRPNFLRLRAIVLERSQQFDMAIELYKELSRLDTVKNSDLTSLAILYHRNGNVTEASNYIMQALQNNPDEPKVIMTAVRIASEVERNVAVAICEQVESILISGASNLWVHRALAKAYKQFGFYEKSLEHFKFACEFEPETMRESWALGDLCEYFGKIQDAVMYYQKSLDEIPNFFNSSLGLGRCLMKDGAFSKAIIEFDRSIQIHPYRPRVRMLQAYCNFKLKRFDLAKQQIKNVLELENIDSEAWIYYSSIVSKIGYTDHDRMFVFSMLDDIGNKAGIPAYETLEDPHVLLAINVLLRSMGENDKAIIYNKRGHEQLECNPLGKVAVLMTLSESLHETEDFEAAVELRMRILNLFPDNAFTNSYLSSSMIQCDKYRKSALTYANKAVELAPTNPSILTNRGVIKITVGNFKEAIDDFSDALKWDVDNYYIYKKIGECYRLMIERDRAIVSNSGCEPNLISNLRDQITINIVNGEKAFAKAIELNSRDQESWTGIGLLNKIKIPQDVESSITAFRHSIEIREHEIPLSHLGELLLKRGRKGDYEEAIEKLVRAVQQCDDNKKIWGTLGHAYRTTKEYDKSIQANLKAIELGENNPEIFYGLFLSYLGNQEYEHALNSLENAIYVKAKTSLVLSMLSRLWRTAIDNKLTNVQFKLDAIVRQCNLATFIEYFKWKPNKLQQFLTNVEMLTDCPVLKEAIDLKCTQLEKEVLERENIREISKIKEVLRKLRDVSQFNAVGIAMDEEKKSIIS